MDNITDIFDSEIQGSDSADLLDADIRTSAAMLQKLAEADGIDLDSLPPDDVADLVTKLSGLERKQPITENEKEAEAHMTTTNTLTHADVAQELSKHAAAAGVDLGELSREELAEAYDKLAADMQTAEYWQQQEIEAQKHAEDEKAYMTGVKIAQGFIEAVNAHFSGEEDDKVAADTMQGRPGPKSEPTLVEGAKGKNFGSQRNVPSGTLHGRQAADTMIDLHPRGPEGSLKNRAGKALREGGEKAMAAAKTRGGKAVIGLTGAAALGYGAKKLYDKSKDKEESKAAADEEIQEMALKIARATLVEHGIHPDTGEALTEEDFKLAAAESLAVEMLQQNGWID